MSCSTPGGMAVTGHLAARRGITVAKTRDLLHAVAEEARKTGIPRPTWDEVETYLLHHRGRAQSDTSIDPEVRDRLVAHYDDALAARRTPSPATWTAWQSFAETHRRLDVLDHVTAARTAPGPTPEPGPEPITDNQIVGIAKALHDHEVDAVVIGGLGGFLHGVPLARTYDADLCVSREPANLDRLVTALRSMDAVLRDPHTGEPLPDVPVGPGLFGPNTGEPLPDVPVGPGMFGPGAQTVIFSTVHGPVDVAFRPDGTTGYEDLDANAVTIAFQGESIRVAATADIIRSKRAANRSKDRETLPAYVEHERRWRAERTADEPPHADA